MSLIQIDSDAEERGLNSTINTTPLVDVMLVLLIIFLITIPVIRNMVPVKLPNAANLPSKTKPQDITVAVTANGDVYWDHELVANEQALIADVVKVAVEKPQPKILIRGDKDVQYGAIGRVLYAVQRGGVVQVSFVTEPTANSLEKYLSSQR
jgi:biopolymer transport protein ExbD